MHFVSRKAGRQQKKYLQLIENNKSSHAGGKKNMKTGQVLSWSFFTLSFFTWSFRYLIFPSFDLWLKWSSDSWPFVQMVFGQLTFADIDLFDLWPLIQLIFLLLILHSDELQSNWSSYRLPFHMLSLLHMIFQHAIDLYSIWSFNSVSKKPTSLSQF